MTARTRRLLAIWAVCLASILLASCAVPPPPDAGTAPDALKPGEALIEVGGGKIIVQMSLDGSKVSRQAMTRYVETAARAVSEYLGRYPVPQVTVNVAVAGAGADIHGVEIEGKLIHLEVGKETRDADIDSDWTITHEMFHLAFPMLAERYSWMNEGLSDYLEPISRARIGTLTPERVWKDFVEGMPQGLAEAGDAGLDNTHTWGRTYWGGCLYWLLADVRIREQTSNRKSLRDAIKALLAAGGDGRATWDIARVIEIGDRATSTTVLRDLHEQLGAKPVNPDLDALWRRLGVRYRTGQVTFDDDAPLAGIRKAITDAKSRAAIPACSDASGMATPLWVRADQAPAARGHALPLLIDHGHAEKTPPFCGSRRRGHGTPRLQFYLPPRAGLALGRQLLCNERMDDSAGHPDAPIRKTCQRWNLAGHAHYLTFSCFQQRPFLSRDRSRQWLVDAIAAARERYRFDLWAWVIMPEHVHLILFPRDETYDISAILSVIKQPVARHAAAFVRDEAPEFRTWMLDHQPNGRETMRFWQRGGGHDYNLYSPRHIWQKIDYLHANPVRRGLVETAVDWIWSSASEYAGTGSGLLPIDRDSLPLIV